MGVGDSVAALAQLKRRLSLPPLQPQPTPKNTDGRILGKHRKVHLFDIDVPGKITFKESDTLTGGGSVTVVDCPFAGGFKLGVGICYDIRLPEVGVRMGRQDEKGRTHSL